MGQMTLVIQSSESNVIWAVQMSRSSQLRCLDRNPVFPLKLVPSHHFDFRESKQQCYLYTCCDLLDYLGIYRG